MSRLSAAYIRSLARYYLIDSQGLLHHLENFNPSERTLHALVQNEGSESMQLFSHAERRRLNQLVAGTGSGLWLGCNDEVNLAIEMPWDPRCFLGIVTDRADNSELRRRVLFMALERIRKAAHLRKVLTMKGVPSCTIRENPYLDPGHGPLENFVESLLEITDPNLPSWKALLEVFLRSAADEVTKSICKDLESLGIRIVFHGTNHAVMDAILNSGLDPNCRQSNLEADYFGLNYNVSLDYTRRKTIPAPTHPKLLVFMVMMGTEMLDRGMMTASSNRQQLPLTEITLCRARPQFSNGVSR